jgi:hypothetical protein
MTAKHKRRFKIGAMKLMDEILDDTGSDQRSSTGLSETATVYLSGIQPFSFGYPQI